jgi:sarcosine oxidase subunit gamma
MPAPALHLRRSPIYRLLEASGARWRDLSDAAVAVTVRPNAAPRKLAVADLSPLPRLGFKGRGTIDAMRKRGVSVEAVPNRAFRQPDGGLCLVLAPGEVLLLPNLAGEGAALAALLAGWRLEDGERTYPVLRRDSHAWFAISGDDAPAMFAKLCAVDLRRERFPDLAVAQTFVAKLSAVVARADAGALPLYHVLADAASALYFCECLLDAAREFGGCLVGLDALTDAAGQ